MALSDRLQAVFVSVFKIEPAEFSLDLTPEKVLRWDSLGHMSLVNELEEQFQVQFDVDEITEMTSSGKILEMLEKKGVA